MTRNMDKNTKAISALQSATNALKALFTSESKFEVAEVADSEQTIQYSVLEVGASVEISSAEGSVVAPDGDYEIKEGVTITVKDGVITEINGLEEEEMEDEPVEDVEAVSIEQYDELLEKVNSLEGDISKITEVVDELPEMFSKITKAIVQLSKLPSEFSKVNKTNEYLDNKESKMNALKNLVANRK